VSVIHKKTKKQGVVVEVDSKGRFTYYKVKMNDKILTYGKSAFNELFEVQNVSDNR